MKPNFALNLTHEAIVLLHRTARGWLSIGEAALDSADLTEALGYLRASALGLSPQGVTTKLILPNSQILYTEVDAPGPDAAARRRQVLAALEGRTPYPVDELVFDTWGKGPRVQVAVVARETLDEAEGFADQHRFNPVSFVAIPPAGAFGGEPFFGQTQAAARILTVGEAVARDQDPVTIVTRDSPREEGPPRASKDNPAKAPATKAAVETAPTIPEPPPTGTKRGEDTGPAAPEKPAEPAASEPLSTSPAGPSSPSAAAAAEAPARAVPPTAGALIGELPPLRDSGLPPAAPVAPAAPPAAAVDSPAPQADPAPPAVPARAKQPDPTPTQAAATPPPAPPPPAPENRPLTAPMAEAAVAPVPSFSSRRREETARAAPPPLPPVPRPGTAPQAPASAKPATGLAAPAPGKPAATPLLNGARSAALAEAPVTLPPAFAPRLAGGGPAPSAPAAATARVAPPLPSSVPPPKPSSNGAASRLKAGTAKPAMGAGPRSLGSQQATATDTGLRPGVAATTLGKAPSRPRGKPRYLGLVLTGVLLIILVLVAAWSSFYLSRNDPASAPAVEVASAPAPALPAAPAPVIVSAGDPVVPEAELLASRIEATPVPQPPVEATAALPDAAGSTTVPDPVVSAPASGSASATSTDGSPSDAAPVPVPDVAAEAGAPPAAPPPAAAAGDSAVALPSAVATTGQDEIFLSAVDSPPPAFDAVALPSPVANPDAAPGTTAPPPPFGTVYQFDDQGRILAGPTGVVAPGGFWLIAARPPRIPPPRPGLASPAPGTDTLAPEATATPSADAAPAPAALSPETAAPAADAPPVADEGSFAPDATITARRPPLRPDIEVPAADPATDPPGPQQADDDASLSSSDARYVGLRPRGRPAVVEVRAAEANTQALAAASLATAAVAEAEATETVANPLAVSLSRRPAARPRDFSRAVAAAAAEVTQPRPLAQPEPEPKPEPQARPDSPEAEPEPEVVASAAPRIPSRASVGKQATYVNAINLSKLNLIGIYGSPSSRYAMVRTSGGRFARVEVGDRVDGGTVAAITASEVRYKKGGRMVTLAMPRS